MYDTSKDDLINELKHKLALISNIKNSFKRIKLNDRLYEYLVQIEKSSNQLYNQVVLIGTETLTYELDKKDTNMLREYSVQKFSISNGEYYKIEWLVDLFENFNFYDIVINNSNILTHWSGNLNKKKIIKQNISSDYLKNLSTNWFMVGKMLPQYKNKFLIENFPNLGINQWSEIIEKIDVYEMKKKIIGLQEHFDKLVTNSDKYIFGSDIYELVEQYNVKELYLHTDVKKDFDDKIIEKNLTSYINFNIIEIKTPDKNILDASQNLIKNYSGILGIKYY